MSDCYRLGIKNFQTIRYPNQIKLAFDLSTNDLSAPRYVTSKGNDYYHQEKITSTNLDYFPIKKSTIDWSKLLINIFYGIFRLLCVSLKYGICIIWCLFKIFCIITKSKRCHSIQCYQHHHWFFFFLLRKIFDLESIKWFYWWKS